MRDMTDEEWYAIIRSFVNGDDSLPDLEDLPAWWDGISPALRNRYLAFVLGLSSVRRWAWDGLHKLHKVLMERREPIPALLQLHVNNAYAGISTPPRKLRNPRYAPKDDRDFRIMRIFNVLREAGLSEKQAKDEIMIALDDMDDGTIRSIFRKMKTYSSFHLATKKPK